jgi:probable O-glycosylation ligase (exosortase A-associated)
MKGLLFTYAMTYGGAVLSLFYPYWGLLIYVCFAILRPAALWHWSVPRSNYSEVIAIAMLVGWALQGFGSWRFGPARGIALSLVAFWAWAAVRAFSAPEQEVAWGLVRGLFNTFLPVVVGLTLIDSVRRLLQLAWVIVLSQGYLAFELNLIYLAGAFDPREFGFAGLDNNGVAITMVTCIGMAFFLMLHAEKWWQKGLAAMCCLPMVHMVLFSMSRGGVLSMLATGGIIFLFIPKKPKHYLAFALAGLLVARLMGPQVIDRFMTTFAEGKERDESAQSRLVYWLATLDGIKDHPVLGVGPGQWKFVCPQYGIRQGRAVHSTWLEVGVEYGLVGLGCLSLFFGLCLARLWRLARGSRPVGDPRLKHLAQMVVVALIGFILSAQFVTMYGVDLPYYVALLGAGVLRVASADPSGVEEPAEAESERGWPEPAVSAAV